MSEPKTIFGKIIAALISIFISNFDQFVAKLWRKVPGELQDKFLLGVKIVERLKTWKGGSFLEFIDHVLTDEIKGIARDEAIEILKSKFLHNGDQVGYFDNGDHKLWQTIASDLNSEFTGVSHGQSVITTEAAYQAFKKEQTA